MRYANTGGNAYKESMLGVLRYIGLENYGTPDACMPLMTDEERSIVAAHLPAVLAEEAPRQQRLRESGVRIKHTPLSIFSMGEEARAKGWTIFMSFEETNEWKAYLRGIAPERRYAASVRRRLCVALWQAHLKRACLWCWVPEDMCACARLEEYRAALPQAALAQVPVTMLLHPEELMRSTNSGHVAAFLLGAPVRLWGVAPDDAYFRSLAVEDAEGRAGADGVLHLSLYPEKNAPTLASVIRELGITEAAPRARNTDVVATAPAEESSAETPSVLAAAATPTPATIPWRRVHLILSDSTWGQALALNRYLPRCIRRVSLDVDGSYDGLFSALRKRTRESGVSTLEATSMALAECLTALGCDSQTVAATTETLTDAMKRYVDLKCLLKFTAPRFAAGAEGEAEVRDITRRRDAARKADAEQRVQELQTRILTDEWARPLLPPPVLNYCYYCERAIGWHRMPEHVLGKRHRFLVENYSGPPTPSALAAATDVPDFSRPPREKAKRLEVQLRDPASPTS